MPEMVTKLQVFVASPGDVQSERDVVSKVVEELNRTIAAHKNLVLEVVRWETHARPGIGEDAQDVVNQAIGPRDIVIGIMWKRIGSPTKRAASGTIEEFERAYNLSRTNQSLKILFYFNKTPFYPESKEANEDFKKVLEFKDILKKVGAFPWTYKGKSGFEKLLRNHLTQLILAWNNDSSPGNPVSTQKRMSIIAKPLLKPQTFAITEIMRDNLLPEKIASNIYSPLSLSWFAENRIALGSRDSCLRIIDDNGNFINEFVVGPGYPSYVDVASSVKVAAITYTHATIIDLYSEQQQKIEIDNAAGGSVLEWSADGQILAVGGTNVLKFYDSTLNITGRQHAVGLKMGVSTLTFAGTDSLYVGIASGEIWHIRRPDAAPEILAKRPSLPIDLRKSPFSERLACLWKDGLLEIREAEGVTACVQLQGSDTWAAHGPKLCWISPEAVCCVDGTSGRLVLWDVSSSKAVLVRLERHALCLGANPAGTRIAVGMGEDDRKDAFLLLFEVAHLKEVLTNTVTVIQTAPGVTRPAHLYTAKWHALLDHLDEVKSGGEPESVVELSLPMIEEEITIMEQDSERWRREAAPEVARQLEKSLRNAKRRAMKISPDLHWLAERLVDKGMQEKYIADALDSTLSVAINQFIGSLGRTGCPPLGSLQKFTAYTLGVAEEELIGLGFEANDGRSAAAYVPIEFLLETRNLVKIGETLGQKYEAATPRQKLYVTCQLFHDFDYAFGYYEGQNLWARYVLPYSFYFGGKEGVIESPSDVVRFGLN